MASPFGGGVAGIEVEPPRRPAAVLRRAAAGVIGFKLSGSSRRRHHRHVTACSPLPQDAAQARRNRRTRWSASNSAGCVARRHRAASPTWFCNSATGALLPIDVTVHLLDDCVELPRRRRWSRNMPSTRPAPYPRLGPRTLCSPRTIPAQSWHVCCVMSCSPRRTSGCSCVALNVIAQDFERCDGESNKKIGALVNRFKVSRTKNFDSATATWRSPPSPPPDEHVGIRAS